MRSLIFVCFLFAMSACKNTTLMHSDKHLNDIHSLENSKEAYTLKAQDKINLSIWNHDNLSIGSIYGIYNSNEVYGKWVMLNEQGNVSLPKVGTVNLLGLSITQAKDKLSNMYSKHIKNPIIDLKVLNREVSILGEVRKPGVYKLEKEAHYLLEFIAKAEGINYYGNAKKVMLIRGHKTYEIDLNSTDDLDAKNVLLKDGDVIHVPTLKGKKIDKKAPILIPFTSVITALAVAFSIFN